MLSRVVIVFGANVGANNYSPLLREEYDVSAEELIRGVAEQRKKYERP
jgi:hypothetical protein